MFVMSMLTVRKADVELAPVHVETCFAAVQMARAFPRRCCSSSVVCLCLCAELSFAEEVRAWKKCSWDIRPCRNLMRGIR